MSTYILPLLRLVMDALAVAAVGFSVVHISFVGVAIIGQKPSAKEEAIGRIKWILIGLSVALGAYFFEALVAYLAAAVSPAIAVTQPTYSAVNPPATSLPGTTMSSGLSGWVENSIIASLARLSDLVAVIAWALSGFTGPNAMALANVQTAKNGDVLGIFAPKTWAAMMYVQHSLYFVIVVAALISFALQGIQIQNAPSSGVAKERAVTLIKNIIMAGLLLGGTPYLLGLANSAVSDFAQYINQLITAHTELLAKSNGIIQLLFGASPQGASALTKWKLFSVGNENVSLANAFFNMVFAIVNLITWLIYQIRRIILAFLITLMPLFYIGLVTGKRTDLVLHWWKEVLSYLLVPVIAMLFLFVAQVFLGI